MWPAYFFVMRYGGYGARLLKNNHCAVPELISCRNQRCMCGEQTSVEVCARQVG